MTVLQVCAYGADYPGNFIASLEALEQALASRGIRTVYAFVERAADKDWCREISRRTQVYFLPEAKARVLPRTYRIMRKIYAENDVDIVHTHFELYDIPATVTAPRKAKIFWHLHDPIAAGHGLRGALWKFQYGVVGRRAKLLSVADFYRRTAVSMGFPQERTATVLNGIDLGRVRRQEEGREKIYDFLTFGWDFERKGDDLILEACDRLEREGYRFRLLLNGNEHTWPRLDAYLQGRTPGYLERGAPVSDINALFDASRVFIQASRKETFSYAVCEAAYSGLPVISSDIAGLEWAHTLPTVTFFPSEDAGALCEAMRAFLDGRAVTGEAVSRTRTHIEETLSLAVWARHVMAHYGLDRDE